MSQTPRGFDAHLAHALANQAGGREQSCPEADVFAAWLDRTLDAAAAMACEEHLAGCARCQAIVAAATADAGEHEEVVPQPPPVSAPLSSPRWHRLVWTAAPVAMAASVFLAVWVARSSRETPLVSVSQDAVQQEAPSGTVPVPEQDEMKTPAPADVPSTPVPAEERLARRTAPPEPLSDARSEREGGAVMNARPAAPDAPAPPAAAAAPAPSLEPRSRAAASAAAASAEKAEATVAESTVMADAGSGTVTIRAPSGTVSWQFDRGGGQIARLESNAFARSVQPATPEAVTRTGDRLRSGAALSDSVAWVVGDAGVVWRTTDGRTWTRVTSPNPEDLTAVIVNGEDAATVTSAKGQRYATADGGRTWRPLP